jgi:hypothetical protein
MPGSTSLPGMENQRSAAALQAAVLLQIIEFTRWPALPAGQDKSLQICVVGSEALAASLRQESTRFANAEFALSTQSMTNLREANACQVLVAITYDERQLRSWLSAHLDKAVLTISNSRDFLQQGGMVALMQERTRLGIRINLPPANRANLKFSSRLLRLAEMHEGDGKDTR